MNRNCFQQDRRRDVLLFPPRLPSCNQCSAGFLFGRNFQKLFVLLVICGLRWRRNRDVLLPQLPYSKSSPQRVSGQSLTRGLREGSGSSYYKHKCYKTNTQTQSKSYKRQSKHTNTNQSLTRGLGEGSGSSQYKHKCHKTETKQTHNHNPVTQARMVKLCKTQTPEKDQKIKQQGKTQPNTKHVIPDNR